MSDQLEREQLDIWEAIKGRDLDLVRAIITRDSSLVNAKSQNTDNWTPLYVAAEHGQDAIVEYLISMVAKVDSINTPGGETPLHTAAFNGHKGVVELLLSKGAYINVRSEFLGQTPLFLAAMNGHTGVVEFLLIKGANPNIKTSDGDSPLNIAQSRGMEAVVRKIQRYSQELKYNLSEFIRTGQILIHPDIQDPGLPYPFTIELALKLLYRFDDFKFDRALFDSAVKSIIIHSGKEVFPRHSFGDGYLYDQTIDEMQAKRNIPEPIGRIRFECGGTLKSPWVRIYKPFAFTEPCFESGSPTTK